MTPDEAAIITAYTGILIGDVAVFHRYVERILERPVMSHEFASRATWDAIQQASKADFRGIEVSP